MSVKFEDQSCKTFFFVYGRNKLECLLYNCYLKFGSKYPILLNLILFSVIMLSVSVLFECHSAELVSFS